MALEAIDYNGNAFGFEQLAGKVVVVMNIADTSNQTPQNINSIKEMVQLYDDCSHRGLEIVAFPSEQRRTSRTAASINFDAWRERMGVRFPIMRTVDINGSQQHPVYRFLKEHGPDVKGYFQTSFVVACVEERCTVQRFDGKPPRALRSHVEECLETQEVQAAIHTLDDAATDLSLFHGVVEF